MSTEPGPYQVLLISQSESIISLVSDLAWHIAAHVRVVAAAPDITTDDYADILIYHCARIDAARCAQLATQTAHFLCLLEPGRPVTWRPGSSSEGILQWFTLIVPVDPESLEFLFKRWKKDDGWLGTVSMNP
jgi:hypothetical protein